MADATAVSKQGTRVKTLFAIHGWLGVLLGLLLYAVIATGVVAVFAAEIGDWSSPLPVRPATELSSAGLDQALRQAAGEIEPRYHDEVSVFSYTGGRLRAVFHTHVKTDDGALVDEGIRFDFDPITWQVVSRSEGQGSALRDVDHPSALRQFLVDLQVRLYLPAPWGLLLTGVLGLAMMVAAVTGLIVHRHLLRELFVLRLSRNNPLLTTRDRHMLAGSWNLLFAFVLAFTGSFFSFAGSFGLPTMAMVAFGGDQEKMLETVIGAPEASDPSPAALANLDTLLANTRLRSGAETNIEFVGIQRWGQADAVVTVQTGPASGALSGRTFIYSGASGELIQEKPLIGLAPSLGNSLIAMMGPLHFGHFAGTVSKAVWFGLGFAGAYVVLSGLMLWVHRRKDQPGWHKFARLTGWMCYGLPLTLAATPIGFFAADWLGLSPLTAVRGAFLLALLAASVLTYITSDYALLRARLLCGCALLLVLAPMLRWLSGGPDWSQALDRGWTEVAALDSLLLLGAFGCVWALTRRPRRIALTPAFSER